MKDLSYQELEQQLQTAPLTWIPALLRALVARAVELQVFRPGALARFVEEARSKAEQ